jgi:uncharacterized protein involved in exopolysaccharide biosynthesis
MLDLAPPTQPDSSTLPGTPFDFRRLGIVVWRAKYLLVAVLVSSAAVGAVVAKTMIPQKFLSTAALVWEPKETPADAIEHERRLRTIVESVKLPRNLSLVRERKKIALSIEQLARTISVNVRPDSSLIQIAVTAEDATEAKDNADHVVQVLIESQTQRHVNELKDQQTRLSVLHEQAVATAKRAREDYDKFRTEHQIIYLPSDREQLIERVRTLASASQTAEVESTAYARRAKALERATRELDKTVVLSEREFMAARQKLANLEAELTGALGTYTEQHPKVLALRAQIEQLKLSNDTGSVIDQRVVGRHPQLDTMEHGSTAARADRDAASARHERLTDLRKRANGRLTFLNSLEGEARRLFSDVAKTEERVSHFQQALTQVMDELAAPRIGLSLLSPASTPTYPIESKRRLVAVSIPAVTSLFALLVVFLLSNRGIRAHSAREHAYWAKLPVAGSACWPKSDDDSPPKLADLLNQASASALLLVPLSSDLGALTDELAQAWNIDAERAADPTVVRRRAREAERVLVVAQSGRHSILELLGVRERIGRHQGVALVLLGVNQTLGELADRAGPVEAFWGAV